MKKGKKPKKKKFHSHLWFLVKRYLANSSIHGIKYLVEDNRHWSERIFWLIACILSWYGCGVLIIDTINVYIHQKVALTSDTSYLHWQVNFPAIHFCFSFSKKAKEYAANMTHIDRRKISTMNRFSAWTDFGYYSKFDIPGITSEKLDEMQSLVQPQCADLFGVCAWNNVTFDCCKVFLPLVTNLGSCLSFNSVNAPRSDDRNLPEFVMNHHKRVSKLTIYLNDTPYWTSSLNFFQMMVTDQIEIPTQLIEKSKRVDVNWKMTNLIEIGMKPTYNDDGVKALDPESRGCKFASETQGLKVLKTYSYYGCVMEAQMQEFNDLCGCVGHLFPQTKAYRTCNYSELVCGLDKKLEILSPSTEHCLPDCEETILTWEPSTIELDPNRPQWTYGHFEISLLPGPFIRYERYTVHTVLDVIIAVGSALGLFVGASVLSVVEIPYWFFLRQNDGNK